jgi:hypothetical protein
VDVAVGFTISTARMMYEPRRWDDAGRGAAGRWATTCLRLCGVVSTAL